MKKVKYESINLLNPLMKNQLLTLVKKSNKILSFSPNYPLKKGIKSFVSG